MSKDHKAKFWECFPNPPAQPAVGDSPKDYLDKLNTLCERVLTWPTAHPTGQLSRGQLRDLCGDPKVDVLIAYAAVMAWGRRGVNSRNYRLSLTEKSRPHLIAILNRLRVSKGNRKADFAAMQKAAASIKGLGISFYTKLLFFFRKKADAYILDQFTAKSAQLLFDPCRVVLTTSGYPHPDNTQEAYEWFCQAAEALAESRTPQPAWTGEQVEQAMFDVRGGAWRKYLRSIYGRNGLKKRKCAKDSPQKPKAPPRISVDTALGAPGGGDSLPERVVRTHATAYRHGCEIPGAVPKVGDATPIRVHCSQNDGVIWQYAFQQTSIHAEVFIPARHVARYDALREFLGVTGHDFGDGIVGNGARNGRTRSIKLTVPRGLKAHPSEWNEIAQQAVAGMTTLFDRVSEIL